MTYNSHGTLITFSWPSSLKTIKQLWEEGYKKAAYWKLCPCKYPEFILMYDNGCRGLVPLLGSDGYPVRREDWKRICKNIYV
jgi:hypothetical protein